MDHNQISESAEVPAQAGDVRITAMEDVEIFNGQDWVPLRRLPREGSVVFREGVPDTTDTQATGDS